MPDQPEIDYVLCDGDGNVLQTVYRVDYPPTAVERLTDRAEAAEHMREWWQERDYDRRMQRGMALGRLPRRQTTDG